MVESQGGSVGTDRSCTTHDTHISRLVLRVGLTYLSLQRQVMKYLDYMETFVQGGKYFAFNTIGTRPET